MKIQKMAILVSCFIFFLCSQLQAQNVTIYGCYKKQGGQFRIVQSPDDCLPSEASVSWNAQSTIRVDPLNIYVNAVTGVDDPLHGLAAGQPFKTIGYALGRVPILRSDSEVQTIINVAAGEYKESITISIQKIWLKGAGYASTLLTGNGSSNVVQVLGRISSRITGFSIKNGGMGLYVSAASLTIENCLIANNLGFAGLFAQNNSDIYLTGTNIRENNVGIFAWRNSSLFLNNCNVTENAGHDTGAIAVWYTSAARLINCEVNSNDGIGIQVGAGSSLQISLSKVHDNSLGGIGVTQMSTVASRGGNTIYSNADYSGWRAGIGAYQGSVVVFTLTDSPVKDKIYDNKGPGVFISNNSSVLMTAGEVTDNQGDGVNIGLGSTGQIQDGASITSNNGYGVGCYSDPSGIIITPGANLTGNDLGPSSCP